MLRLTANDGAASANDQVQIIVDPAGALDRRVAVGSDDAEERGSGSTIGRVTVNNGDLELVFDNTNQTVGLRFTNVTIPPGAIIARAYVQFQADELQSEVTNLLIRGQAADNPATFTTATSNISTRPRTAAGVSWSPPAWTLVGEAGANQRTSDLSAVIQEIVNRPGWVSGSALAIIITGTGHRTAESFEGKAAAAPLLHVEFSSGSPAAANYGTRAAEAYEPRPEVHEPRLAFALLGVGPNPTRGPLRIEFSLADRQPAMLELLDVAGRRVAAHEVGSWGPGRHQLDLRGGLPAGVYLVRLTQGSQARVMKAVLLR